MTSHDFRLVSERTVEENILKKANQKKMLGDIAIEGGAFTTEFFKKVRRAPESCDLSCDMSCDVFVFHL